MDLEGNNYCGFTIDWNYDTEYVEISMLTYIPKSLKRFLHPTPKNIFCAPHKWTVPAYGQTTHYLKGPDNITSLDEKFTKDIYSKVRSFI